MNRITPPPTRGYAVGWKLPAMADQQLAHQRPQRRRFHRLGHHSPAALGGHLAQPRIALGGHQHHRRACLPLLRQRLVQHRTVVIAHAHIQQHQFRHGCGTGQLQRRLRAVGQHHLAAPAFQQRAAGCADVRIVIDHPDPTPAQRIVRGRFLHQHRRRCRGGNRAGPDRMAKQAADAVDDGQAKAGTALLAREMFTRRGRPLRLSIGEPMQLA
ncbi:hypothetical protein G6F65_019916 [Rhizopus arrhizus]|nr:hypothetical protein G6F65_019916 [Rhizopus arrhizus]